VSCSLFSATAWVEAADALVLVFKAAAGYPTMSFDLTGARVKTRPVAARMAATTE
jgi:hypothetical protein